MRCRCPPRPSMRPAHAWSAVDDRGPAARVVRENAFMLGWIYRVHVTVADVDRSALASKDWSDEVDRSSRFTGAQWEGPERSLHTLDSACPPGEGPFGITPGFPFLYLLRRSALATVAQQWEQTKAFIDPNWDDGFREITSGPLEDLLLVEVWSLD